MSKNISLFNPVLAKSRGKNADKKVWQNLPGSSATVAIFNGGLSKQQPILMLTPDTPSPLSL